MLPPFGAKLGEKTKTALEKLGVEVQLGAMVVDVDEWGIDVQDKDGTRRRIEATTKVWAAGVQASPLGKLLGEQTGAAARPRRPDQRQPRPDAAGPPRGVRGRRHDQPRPPARRRAGRDPGRRSTPPRRSRPGCRRSKAPQKPFKYFDKGSMATISRFRAVALIGKIRLTGFVAWLMWLARAPRLHDRLQEPGRRPRALDGQLPGPRPVASGPPTEQQIFARAALQRLEGGAADLVSSTG